MAVSIQEKIDAAFSSYPKRVYPKGQILVFANKSPESIFYIVKGRVRQYDISYRGDEVIVNIFKPPAFFPMSWALNHTPNKYFYKTEVATELHIVPADHALAFIKANPDIMLDLLCRVYRGVDGMIGRIVHLMSGTAQSRLIYELVVECLRFGVLNPDESYTLDVNEAEIAARSGLSRETVSREIRKLKEHDSVTLVDGKIVVKTIAALQEKLGTDD